MRPFPTAFLLLALLTLSPGMPAADLEGFMPAWKVGDAWVVEARYRNLAEGGTAWLPPIRWRFHVRAAKEVDGEPCLMLHVVPLGRPDLKIQAVLWLSARDLRPVRVVDVYPLRGVATARRREFDPRRLTPLFHETSMIPYDLPLFPFCGSGQPASPTVVLGENAMAVASTTFVDRVSQTWSRTATGFAVELDAGGPAGTIRQEWRPGLPWAVSQVEHGLESILINPPGRRE